MKVQLLIACAAMLASGCTAYRFSSEGTPCSLKEVKGRYRVAHVNVNLTKIGYGDFAKSMDKDNHFPFSIPDSWSMPQVASSFEDEVLRQAITKSRPDVFGDDPTLQPIDILISCEQENKGLVWTRWFPFFLLEPLGTLLVFHPTFCRTASDCTVEVRYSSTMSPRASHSIRFVSEVKDSPFGLIPFGVSPNIMRQREGMSSITFQNDAARQHLLEVFAETIADFAVEQISEMERKGQIRTSPVKPIGSAPVRQQ